MRWFATLNKILHKFGNFTTYTKCNNDNSQLLTRGRVYFQSSSGKIAFRTTIDPLFLVEAAIERKELVELLLGRDDYICLPKHTCHRGKTDIDELYTIYCKRFTKYTKIEKRDMMTEALFNIVEKYDGIMPAAWCYYLEASMQKKVPEMALGLPLLSLSSALRKSITRFAVELALNGTEEGSNFPHGRLDYLHQLNQMCLDYEAPPFID